MNSTTGSPASATTPPATSVCAKCGSAFRCGSVAGDATCWCFELPHLFSVPGLPAESGEPASSATCLCPACLQQAISLHADPATD
ncbi:MAG: cysteine-rich CWC family protein [Pseudomonadota bacterium]